MKMQVIMKIPLVLVWASMVSCQPKPYTLTTASPNHTYSVQLVERLNPTDEPSYNHVVGLKIYSGGRLIADDPHFSRGVWPDERFGRELPEHGWVGDNMLRFGKTPLSSQTKYDEVLIHNNTAKIVTYLVINGASEMLLLVDLQPNTTKKVTLQSQTYYEASTSWIGYAGQFAGGGRIESDGLNFRVRGTGKYVPPSLYCITIKDDGVTVRSRDYEGVSYLGGVERVFPIASDCGE
jgi:hypothetical protein